MLMLDDLSNLEKAIIGAIGEGKEKERKDILDTVTHLWKGFFKNPVTNEAGLRQLENDITNWKHIRQPKDNQNTYCIMVDVDNFRMFNKKYGTFVGDKVLQEVAYIINETTRDEDIVARANSYHLHGEELCVLYTCNDLEDAVMVADRVRCAVEEKSVQKTNHRVTISLGVAQYHPDIEKFTGTMERADRYMLCAKNEGRNRVYTNEDGRDPIFKFKMNHLYKGGISTAVIEKVTKGMSNVKGLLGRTMTHLCQVGTRLYK
ncbi:GGDEF domain-containing protein [Candidatus Woesearchaeota archaeon]|nr:GGDEF domain-containing protein [Candidatus Woesearchaeota archaeon]MBT5397455.1 GGDEF domain-containing protein [Candidatus Woesearchaeota archaeon]MBT6367972.1 GGDEF domain-containing protein [Candidatus Woesearchaeota archaeon]MBT7763196.1 GGDEF domain-containing protein [Candidatus Woesearchaeota archaeon]